MNGTVINEPVRDLIQRYKIRWEGLAGRIVDKSHPDKTGSINNNYKVRAPGMRCVCPFENQC